MTKGAAQRSRWTFYEAVKEDIFQFLEQHPEIEVVCFDFFDTIVSRTVEPEHTKRLASRQLGIFLGEEIGGNLIYKWRRELEAKLCNQNAAAGNDHDFNIIVFASEFYQLLKEKHAYFPKHLSEKEFQNVLLQIEITIEKRVQISNKNVHDLLLPIAQKGIRIAVISDFYIPKQYFKSFLDHHGLSSHIDRIFISADFGLKKSSGRLYDPVLSHYRCDPKKIVMIGDNEHSDILIPKNKGIHTFHVGNPGKPLLDNKPDREEHLWNNPSRSIEDDFLSVIREHGNSLFPEIGIILWRFIYLLFQKMIRDGVRQVFFFSKEGEFLKVLFDQFQMDQFGCRIIDSHYLMVSRKSTYICSLKPLGEEDFIGIFRQYRSISPRDFLLSLNFSENEAGTLCNETGIDYEKKISEFPASPVFQSILQSKSFADLYEYKRDSQKRHFIKYLESFGIDFYNDGLNIVDVGWKGSIQDNIFFTLGGNVNVRGYYIGLLNPTNISGINIKSGILFSNHGRQTPFFEVYRSNTSLFEIVLAATHGSADSYLSDPPNSESHDTIRVSLVELPEERKLFDEQIRPMQQCILEVCHKINLQTSVSIAQKPSGEWFARQHARMVYRPSRKEIGFFESLYHLENFGIFEFTEFNSHNRLSVRQRWENIKTVTENPSHIIEKGTWHPILLKRMGVGFMSRSFGEGCYRKSFSEEKAISFFSGKKILNGLDRLKTKRSQKIAFFLGIPDINGGTYVIFEHAVALKKKGYQVFILTREDVHPSRYAWHPEAGELEWMTIGDAGHLRFDFAVATWWLSTILLRQVNASSYLYFVQSIESRFFPSDEKATYEEKAYKRLAANTYLMPLPVITEAVWIQKYLNDNYGIDAFLVRNGIRKDLYTESGFSHEERQPGKLKVLIEGPLGVPYKMVGRAVELARKSDADDVWLLTSSRIDSFEGAGRVFSQVPIRDTPPIYRSCDVLLKLSTVEGMFGPPLEMFHCGGTSIVYDVTGHNEYIRHNVNSFVIPMEDEPAVITHLNLLKHEPEILERLKNGARATAEKWPDWGSASDHFEKVLKRLNGRSWPNRTYLSKASDYFFQSCENDMKLLYELEDRPTVQWYQVYWHFGEGFSEPNSWKKEYKSGEWVTFKTRLKPNSKTIYLRIDPCMQTGVVFIERILISDVKRNRLIMKRDAAAGWHGIEIGGTASLIHNNAVFAIEATGPDPQIMMPHVPIDETVSEIVFEVVLKFLPHRKALYEIFSAIEKRAGAPFNKPSIIAK